MGALSKAHWFGARRKTYDGASSLKTRGAPETPKGEQAKLAPHQSALAFDERYDVVHTGSVL
jgi:hypothetical protein